MSKYIKKFDTHADYAAYIGGSDKILPNVSYCENENELHYNPYSDPRLIVKYTVEDDSEQTLIYGYYAEEGEEEYWVRGIDLFDKIEIDGVEVSISDIDSDEGNYQLSDGEHTIRYTLKDPTTIGDWVFYECSSLTSVTIPNSVTTIGEGAFSGCSSLTSVTIPNTVTTIGQEAFYGCSSLTSVTIPNSVTTIGIGAFNGCSGLTSVTIPNTVTTIGQSAFSGCSSLTSVTIGSGVATIGIGAFNGCSGLTSITVEATTPPTLDDDTVFYDTNNCPIYVPAESVAAYKAPATNWITYAIRIEAIS